MNDPSPSTGRLLRAVFVLLAAVLIVTGLLKLDGLRGNPEVPVASTSWFLLAGWSAVELAFAGWLLSGLYPRWTRLAALALFLTLFNVALSRALAGEASCGCAGATKIDPWWAVAFDGAAILLLVVALPPVEAPRGRWRYAVAGACVLAAVVTTGMGIQSAQWHPSGTGLPAAQGKLLVEVVRGIEKNEASLAGLKFESNVTYKNNTIDQPITKRRKLKGGGEVVLRANPVTETTYQYIVSSDGVKRIEAGSNVHELVRGQETVELRPDVRTVWIRPSKSDPRNTTSRLDPSTWGFYVPFARPTDWLAELSVELVESLEESSHESARLEARSEKGNRIVVVFDSTTNWLPTTLEQFDVDGSLIERTEVTYQPCPNKLGWLPKSLTTWGWPAGKVWSADKNSAPYRTDHVIGHVTIVAADSQYLNIEIPDGFRVLDAVGTWSVTENLTDVTQVAELLDSHSANSHQDHAGIVWTVLAVNVVLLIGCVVVRRKLAL